MNTNALPATILAGLSPAARWLLKLACRPGGTAVRGVGAGKGVAAIARGLERRGLIAVDRRHWRDHDARGTALGQEVATLIPETQLKS